MHADIVKRKIANFMSSRNTQHNTVNAIDKNGFVPSRLAWHLDTFDIGLCT